MSKPCLSISMVTYNHEKYISEAIEGVLLQNTDFRIKLFITDDKSPDQSAIICQQYADKYPDLIDFECFSENKGMMENWQYNLNKCIQSGADYIALCEGDDYWTDPLKLQKQVDFLEENQEFGMVCTDYHKYYQESGKYKYNCFKFDKYKDEVKFEDYVFDRSTIGTKTVVLRRSLLVDYTKEVLDNLNMEFNVGDTPLWLYVAIKSRIKVLKDVTAIYRILNNSACHFDDLHKHYAFVMKGFEVPDFFLTHYNFPTELIIKNETRKLKSILRYSYRVKNKSLFIKTLKKINLIDRNIIFYLWRIGLINQLFYKIIQFLLK